MPTYDYACPDCGHVQEEFHSIKLSAQEANIRCAKCGSRPMERKISGGAGFVLKGEGYPSKKFRIDGQMRKSQERAEKKQAIEWGHMKSSPSIPNCDGEITGEPGDPEAWRQAGKVAAEKGYNTSEYDKKAKECEDARVMPDHLKTSRSFTGSGSEKKDLPPPSEKVVAEIPKTHKSPSNE